MAPLRSVTWLDPAIRFKQFWKVHGFAVRVAAQVGPASLLMLFILTAEELPPPPPVEVAVAWGLMFPA